MELSDLAFFKKKDASFLQLTMPFIKMDSVFIPFKAFLMEIFKNRLSGFLVGFVTK